MTDFNTIRTSVLSRIKPSQSEKARLKALASRIIGRINSIGESEVPGIRAILVGSSARGTWISGQHDLDIFIMFPPFVDREYLEEKGLYVARKIALAAEKYEERYAEHPYIHAIIEGFEVDMVPAFNVASASEIKSAVDRTPFHNNYVAARIKGIEEEVLLLKQFLKGIGVYGSELRTCGFSGYLVELLIIHFGSFLNVLEAACQWKTGITIDIEKHGIISHKDPMVMIDPTDPARNVAAALSLDNLCIFIDKACEFLNSPGEEFFQPKVPEALDDDGFMESLGARGTSLIAIEFEAPDVVEDVLFPQLYKFEDSAKEMLEKHDFCVYNSAVWHGKKAIVLFELESEKLPFVRKHTGPQVWMKEHASSFKSKYMDADTFSNVFIQNGRYMVEIQRKYTHASQLLRSEIRNCALGKHISISLKKEFNVLLNEEILNITHEDFRRLLRKFFEK